MKNSVLNSVIGFVVGCLIVAGAGAAYWYWLQMKNPATSTQSVAPPKVETAKDTDADTNARKKTETKAISKQNDAATPTKLTMTREIATNSAFSPGQPMDITITLKTEGTDPIRALGIEEHIPAGWRFDSILEGVRPDITPRNPDSQLLEFAWFNIPKFPAKFTYRLIAGTDMGNGTISGESIFRTSGPEYRSGVVTTSIDPTAAPAQTPTLRSAVPPKMEEKAPESPAEPQKEIPKPTSAPPKKELEQNVITSDFALMINGQEAGYKSGLEMPLEVGMDYAGSDKVTALAINLSLPKGWRFKAVTGGTQPAVPPQEGAAGDVALIWINIPEFPTATQINLMVPENATGSQTLSGQILYRTNGGELRSALVDVLIQPAA